jgi:hypothetical protein
VVVVVEPGAAVVVVVTTVVSLVIVIPDANCVPLSGAVRVKVLVNPSAFGVIVPEKFKVIATGLITAFISIAVVDSKINLATGR